MVCLYECKKCSYRTVNENYIKQHIYLHRLKKQIFYYCSFCGFNHQYRTKIIVHIAKTHPDKNSSNCLMSSNVCNYLLTEREFLDYFIV